MTDLRVRTFGVTVRAGLRSVVAALCIAAVLGGCATKTQTGAAVGAATGVGVGALIGGLLGGGKGAAIGAAVGGAVGAGVGGIIGNQLDARDKERRNAVLQASLQNAKPNQPVPWVNPDTGNSGTITPGAAWVNPDSVPSGATTPAVSSRGTVGAQATCRDFNESYTREGSTYTQKSRACLGQDGTWVVQN